MLNYVFEFLFGEDDYAYFLLQSAKNGQLDLVKRYLTNPKVRKIATADNNAALRSAARNGHLGVVRELMKLKAVAYLERVAPNANCALKEAAEYGKTNVFMLLLEDPKIHLKFMNQDLNLLNFALARRSKEMVLKALTSPAVKNAVIANPGIYLRSAFLTGREEFTDAILDALPEEIREKALVDSMMANRRDRVLNQFNNAPLPRVEVGADVVSVRNTNGKRTHPG